MLGREFRDVYAKVAPRLDDIRGTISKIASKKLCYTELLSPLLLLIIMLFN